MLVGFALFYTQIIKHGVCSLPLLRTVVFLKKLEINRKLFRISQRDCLIQILVGFNKTVICLQGAFLVTFWPTEEHKIDS